MWRQSSNWLFRASESSAERVSGREAQNLMALSAKVWGHYFYQKEIPARMAGLMPPSNAAYSLYSGRCSNMAGVRPGDKQHTQKGVVIAESLRKRFFSNVFQSQQEMMKHP